MRALAVAVALLGMVDVLQARETDFPRGEALNSAATDRQLATSSAAVSRSDTEKPRRNGRRSHDFSAERFVPDICTGC